MAEEEKKEESPDYGKKLKQLQMNMLDKIGSGGLNQNDLMAVMQMMQKDEPDSLREMMQMAMMAQMMHPQQDPMSQILPLVLMDGMKSDGDSELKRELEAVKAELRKRDSDRQTEAVMKEVASLKSDLREAQKGRDQLGAKDLITIMSNNSDKIATMYKQMNDSQRENFKNMLDMKIKDSGSSLGKIGEQIKELRALTETVGFGAPKEKSNTEIIKDLVGGVASSLTQSEGFNTALSGLGHKWASESSPQQQAQKLQQIRANRQPQDPGIPIPAKPAPDNPTPTNPIVSETVEAKPDNQEPQMYMGQVVEPSLIDISSGPAKAIRRPVENR